LHDSILIDAVDAVIVLDRELNKLLDVFDEYIEQNTVQDASFEFELTDVLISIKELGELPYYIGMAMASWRNGTTPVLTCDGFNYHILNEMELHLFALYLFLKRKLCSDISNFNADAVHKAMVALRTANNNVTHPQLRED
jgi:hypothetical protein